MTIPRRKLLPLTILASLLAIAALVVLNPPEADRRPPSQAPKLTVEVTDIERGDFQVRLQSYGVVRPRTQSFLVSQVGGQVISVSANFRDGGFFEAGDVLLKIDPRDYRADVRIAEATLMDARQALAEEQARSAQAVEDWRVLSEGGEENAPDLVLRKPQLAAAEARVISARSGLEKARLDLERTEIVAPFAGRILENLVDVGQVVSANTQLAEIYATDYVEIRLPLRNRDLAYIDLPESFRYGDNGESDAPRVTLYSDLGQAQSWKGRIVRTESAIDNTARQLHVVAQVDDPFSIDLRDRQPLKIGQYVSATIEGRRLEDAIVIPNKAIYQGSFVYLVANGVLKRREIEIGWQNDRDALITRGLSEGDKVVVTSLGQVTSGIRVTISGETSGTETPGPQQAKDSGGERPHSQMVEGEGQASRESP